MRTVTPGDEGCLATDGGAVRILEFGDDAVTDFLKAKQLRLALDFDARAAKVLDEQLFVLLLRENQRARKGTQSLADVHQRDAGFATTPNPNANVRNLKPPFDDLLGNPELRIELQGAGLHRQGAGRRSRARNLVDE